MSVETGPIHPSPTPRDPEAGARAMLAEDVVRRAPKALLHDHLDGGVRPATIIDLAAQSGYDLLPSNDPDELSRWFVESADSGSLVRYLETFAHTVGVMQTREALVRVASECAEDHAADGVIHRRDYVPLMFG